MDENVKDPTSFLFSNPLRKKVEDITKGLEDALKNSSATGSKDKLDTHRVYPEEHLQKQSQEQDKNPNKRAQSQTCLSYRKKICPAYCKCIIYYQEIIKRNCIYNSKSETKKPNV